VPAFLWLHRFRPAWLTALLCVALDVMCVAIWIVLFNPHAILGSQPMNPNEQRDLVAFFGEILLEILFALLR